MSFFGIIQINDYFKNNLNNTINLLPYSKINKSTLLGTMIRMFSLFKKPIIN